MRNDFIYFDYNATTPIDPRVAAAMRPCLTGLFGNPSSLHRLGREARDAVEKARSQVAACLGASPQEIVFTSGGTESNNLALRGAIAAGGGGHVITSAVEHPAVLEVLKGMEAEGLIRLTVVGVDRKGRVDPADMERAAASDTVLVSVMLANNEVGALQPVAEIARFCRERRILVHTDAAQAVGKVPVRVDELGVDLLSVAGHKMYAPKGIGALYVREGVKLAPVLRGAGHERGLRPGTENVLEAVGLGAACAVAAAELEEETARLAALRDKLLGLLRAGFPELVVHGEPRAGLPNTLSVAFPGVDAGLLLARLADEVGASAGAACHTDEAEPSHVLAAMGVERSLAMCTVRLSLGRFTTEEEIERGAERILSVAREIASPPAVRVSAAGSVKLTAYTHGMGCACKLDPRLLERVLRSLPAPDSPRVAVGPETSDDACAWRLDGGLLLVQSLDFFTPVVDSPRLFGAIAAANSLSDIYAMGARPLFALNVVAFPSAVLPEEVLREILEGALETAEEAGIPILGGHTIEDNEPKFGLVVTGVVEEKDLWRNRGARPGDLLLLTKPVGTGIWATAAKKGVSGVDGWDEAVSAMRSLNRAAADVLRRFSPHAVTDVTGFGLLGHLHEMLDPDVLSVELWADDVPVLPGAERLAAMGDIPGGTKANLAWAEGWTNWDDEVDELRRVLLADANTSGGLLAALEPSLADEACAAMRGEGIRAALIGRFTAEGGGKITVLPRRKGKVG